MVLESLLSPQGAIKRPWVIFGLGFVYATVGLFLSMWVFRDYVSLVMVFLTVMAVIPLFMQFMDTEEDADLSLGDENQVLKQHGKALVSFIFLFMGMSIAYAIFYVVFRDNAALFNVQSQTIVALRTGVTGHSIAGGMFFIILVNNLKVLMFCILFSFIYGAGSIFILTWNASVIGVALGNFYQQGVTTATGVGNQMLVSYAAAAGMSAMRYLIHGIPEIAGYFVGGLAGGVLSAALVKQHYADRGKMDRVLLDTSDLIIIGVIILVVAAVIETWITPLLV